MSARDTDAAAATDAATDAVTATATEGEDEGAVLCCCTVGRYGREMSGSVNVNNTGATESID